MYSALELAKNIRKHELSISEALDLYFTQINAKESEMHSFITLTKEYAYADARRLQAYLDAGNDVGPLFGVPIAIKDNICTNGIRTTCASKMLESFVPPYDATVIERIKNAGMIIVGKTNMDEFAFGSTTETSAFGITKNPVNTEYVPGGSSGGSAAAVAACEAALALGSDTGGSVRNPASHCGVVGMKPTYGLVSRYGLVAYASSLDQIGPIGVNVSDCAALLDVIAGKDERDSTSVSLSDHLSVNTGVDMNGGLHIGEDKDLQHNNISYLKASQTEPQKLRVGIPVEYFSNGLNKEVKQAVLRAADVLKALGADVEEFSLQLTEYAVPAYYVIASAEASSNLERYDGVKYGHRAASYDTLHEMIKKSRSEGFGSEAKRRIMLGTFVLSEGYYDAYYLKALRTKSLLMNSFEEAFKRYDIILSPVSPDTAPKIGESYKDPVKMYLDDVYTVCANLLGLPAISLPCGVDGKGLPIGVQLMGPTFSEKTLLSVAGALERSL